VTLILVYATARMLVRSVNNEIEGIWKEAVVTLVRDSSGLAEIRTGENLNA